MTKLKIIRTSELSNMGREFGVYLDGQKIGTISNGEIKEFDVPAGRHQLQAKIDWCSSNDLDFKLNEDEIVSFTISGNKYANYPLLFMGVLLILIFTFKIKFLVWVCIPLICMSIYFLTIGRNQYLKIRES